MSARHEIFNKSDTVMSKFDSLPFLVEGESKIVRRWKDGQVAIKYKPTVYSFTHNRAGEIAGSDKVRFASSHILNKVLEDNSIPTAFLLFEEHEQIIIAKEIPYVPIEVICKAAHVGTPKHLYYGMGNYPTRNGTFIRSDEPCDPYVRFDWRNPNVTPDGVRMGDMPLPEALADHWIDTRQAATTAMTAFTVLSNFLQAKGLKLIDICFQIDATGQMIFSELSPDCMRVRDDQDSLDKDVWRMGGSSQDVLKKWHMFLDRIL
jgi:phosphoribosylaminoimidazole-succinocarboxamide synthase